MNEKDNIPMNDKDKWSAHLEYLKTAITIAAAILAVASAIYSDPTKIPRDFSKYILLLSAVFVLLTLVSSIMAVIKLSNYLINPSQKSYEKAASITKYAGGSFFGLIAAGVCLTIFFAWRSVLSNSDINASISLDNVVKDSRVIIASSEGYETSAVKLSQIEAKDTYFEIKFFIDNKLETFNVRYDTTKSKIDRITRQ